MAIGGRKRIIEIQGKHTLGDLDDVMRETFELDKADHLSEFTHVIARGQALLIKHVFYMGDEAGMVCDVTPDQEAKEVFIVSLTHLRVDSSHPLAQEMRAYQAERMRRIAQSGGMTRASQLTVRPRKKRRR